MLPEARDRGPQYAYGDIPALWESLAHTRRIFVDVSDLSVRQWFLVVAMVFGQRLFADEFHAARSSFFAEENGEWFEAARRVV